MAEAEEFELEQKVVGIHYLFGMDYGFDGETFEYLTGSFTVLGRLN